MWSLVTLLLLLLVISIGIVTVVVVAEVVFDMMFVAAFAVAVNWVFDVDVVAVVHVG